MMIIPGTLRLWTPLPGPTGLRIALLVALALMASACQSPVAELDRTVPSGGAMSRALAHEYAGFARFEANEMVDWADANRFAAKALRAARGEAVAPEATGAWRLPADAAPGIDRARKRLVAALVTVPGDDAEGAALAARAQSRFDCWVEQQEENWQADDIAACRDGFLAALRSLENRPGVAEAQIRLVPFAFDSDALVGSSRALLADIAGWARDVGATGAYVSAHADRAGSATYNAGLSLRRALAVRAALVAGGLAPEQVEFEAFGEDLPRVVTADGVRAAANRRAEITLHLPPIAALDPGSERMFVAAGLAAR